MSEVSSHRESPNTVSPLRVDSLADSVLILLSLMGIQRLIGFFRAIVFCRWLDVAELGQWDMAFGFLMLAAPVSVLALSSCFRRYVAYYGERGQLRMLIRRTALIHLALAVVSVVIFCLLKDWFSRLIFGSTDESDTVLLLALSLLSVIAFHYFIDLLSAVRNVRLNAGLQMINSIAFATLGIALLLVWHCDARSVVVAYGSSCAIAAIVGICWLRRIWSCLPQSEETVPFHSLVNKIVPFSFSIWVTSLLTNLLFIVDRYMIVHYSELPSEEALVQVGYYHSSRLIPVLLVSVLELLGGVIMPYLSCDWEAGRRDRVGTRLNLLLKLSGLGICAVSAAVLLAGPLLFEAVLGGKFAAGLDILPWTLTYCVWYGILGIAQAYLLCTEKAGAITAARAASLLASIGLNLLLLPWLGLQGAVLAAAGANLLCLVLVMSFSRRQGFHADRGCLVVLALPLIFPLGAWPTLFVVAALALSVLRFHWIFSADEKQRILERGWEYAERLRAVLSAIKWRIPLVTFRFRKIG